MSEKHEPIKGYSEVEDYRTIVDLPTKIGKKIKSHISNGWDLYGPQIIGYNGTNVVQVVVLRKENAHIWYKFLEEKPQRVLEAKVSFIVSMMKKDIKREDAYRHFCENNNPEETEYGFNQLYGLAEKRFVEVSEQEKADVYTMMDAALKDGWDLTETARLMDRFRGTFETRIGDKRLVAFIKLCRQEMGDNA